MVAIRGRTFKKPWQRSYLSSKLKSSSAPIGREDSWCFHAVGSSNAPLLGSTAAEGLPRIGRTSIATHWRSCGLPQSASCSENFVIPPDVFGQTLRNSIQKSPVESMIAVSSIRVRSAHGNSFDHLAGAGEQRRWDDEAKRVLAPGYKDKRQALIYPLFYVLLATKDMQDQFGPVFRSKT